MMTNQAVREHLIERQASMQIIQKLAEGKADIMFSKDAQQELINKVNKCAASCCGDEGILVKKYEEN